VIGDHQGCCRAFAGSRGHLLGAVGPNIAAGEDPRDAGLEECRFGAREGGWGIAVVDQCAPGDDGGWSFLLLAHIEAGD